jgi:F-type H+-transporting ATPase subunit b
MAKLIDNPEFWVLIAFLCFCAMLLWAKVPSLIGKSLDDRAEAIRKELDEAQRLRKEAEQLLADYQRKAREAESEAKSIIETANREAEALAAQAKKSLAESLERRTKMAEEKIARAEAQAVSEVRSTAVDVAVRAAEKVLASKAAGGAGAGLIDESIKALKAKLN